MRLFIGIWLSEPMRTEVVRYINKIKEQFQGFKWSTPDQLHFTLKFLGETHEKNLKSLITTLKTVTIGRLPFTLRLGDPGRFPERGNPQILWLGVSNGKKEIEILGKAIENACIYCGFSPANQIYKPHLTIARAKERRLGPRTYSFNIEAWQSVTLVSGFSLIESRLKPHGAIYRTIQEFPFS